MGRLLELESRWIRSSDPKSRFLPSSNPSQLFSLLFSSSRCSSFPASSFILPASKCVFSPAHNLFSILLFSPLSNRESRYFQPLERLPRNRKARSVFFTLFSFLPTLAHRSLRLSFLPTLLSFLPSNSHSFQLLFLLSNSHSFLPKADFGSRRECSRNRDSCVCEE